MLHIVETVPLRILINRRKIKICTYVHGMAPVKNISDNIWKTQIQTIHKPFLFSDSQLWQQKSWVCSMVFLAVNLHLVQRLCFITKGYSTSPPKKTEKCFPDVSSMIFTSCSQLSHFPITIGIRLVYILHQQSFFPTVSLGVWAQIKFDAVSGAGSGLVPEVPVVAPGLRKVWCGFWAGSASAGFGAGSRSRKGLTLFYCHFNCAFEVCFSIFFARRTHAHTLWDIALVENEVALLARLQLFHVVSTFSQKTWLLGIPTLGLFCVWKNQDFCAQKSSKNSPLFGEEMPLIACSGDTGGVLGKTSHLGRELKLRAIGALDVLDVGSVGKCRLEKIWTD